MLDDYEYKFDDDFIDDEEETVETEHMLTTFDNPFNYFDDFIPWLMYDLEKGYQTCEILALFVHDSDDMTQKEKNLEIERAIDEIIFNDPLNFYRKLTRKVPIY